MYSGVIFTNQLGEAIFEVHVSKLLKLNLENLGAILTMKQNFVCFGILETNDCEPIYQACLEFSLSVILIKMVLAYKLATNFLDF